MRGAVLNDWEVEIDDPFSNVQRAELSMKLDEVVRARQLRSHLAQPLRDLPLLIDAAVRPSCGRRCTGKAVRMIGGAETRPHVSSFCWTGRALLHSAL